MLIQELHLRQAGKDDLSNVRHFHKDSYELIHVLSGSGNMLIGRHVYPLAEKTIFFLDGAVWHCSAPKGCYIRSKLIIGKKEFQILQSLMGTEAFVCPPDGICVKLDSNEQPEMLLLSLSRSFARQQSALKSLSLFSSLLLLVSEGKQVQKSNSLASSVAEYVHAHLSEDLSLDALSEAMHISKYYFCHKFLLETGMTIQNYVRSQRISAASSLLENTSENISIIAQRVGFDNFSHFSKVFNAYLGTTPSGYRRKKQ